MLITDRALGLTSWEHMVGGLFALGKILEGSRKRGFHCAVRCVYRNGVLFIEIECCT